MVRSNYRNRQSLRAQECRKNFVNIDESMRCFINNVIDVCAKILTQMNNEDLTRAFNLPERPYSRRFFESLHRIERTQMLRHYLDLFQLLMGLIREENPAENPAEAGFDGNDGEWYTEEVVARMSLEQKTNRLRSLTTLLKSETQRVGEKIDVELPEFTEEIVLQLSDEIVARYMNTIGDLLDEYAQYE